MDRHLHVVGIVLDLSKVYDLTNHNILFDKLHSYGVRGSSNMWIKSYLTNRTQFVEISQTERSNRNQHKFQFLPRVIAHPQPQGSILGSLVFLVHINDLPFNIQEAKLLLYADDTNILIVDKNEALQTKLSSVMKQLEIWFFNKDLIINTIKIAAMSLHLCQ